MKRLFLLFGLSLSISGYALAIEVTYSGSFCRLMAEHTPRDDVTYQPGVDVQGKPAVLADLNGAGGFELPETIKIPLSVNLAQEFGLNDFADQDLNAPLGTLEITKDGRVLQNGRDLTGRAHIICKEESGQPE